MSMAEQFQAAILALYGADPAAQQAANQWLNDFAPSASAWDACLAGIDASASPTAAFFCANMILTKLRREWGKLPAEQRGSLRDVLGCGAAEPSARTSLPGSFISTPLLCLVCAYQAFLFTREDTVDAACKQ